MDTLYVVLIVVVVVVVVVVGLFNLIAGHTWVICENGYSLRKKLYKHNYALDSMVLYVTQYI